MHDARIPNNHWVKEACLWVPGIKGAGDDPDRWMFQVMQVFPPVTIYAGWEDGNMGGPTEWYSNPIQVSLFGGRFAMRIGPRDVRFKVRPVIVVRTDLELIAIAQTDRYDPEFAKVPFI